MRRVLGSECLTPSIDEEGKWKKNSQETKHLNEGKDGNYDEEKEKEPPAGGESRGPYMTFKLRGKKTVRKQFLSYVVEREQNQEGDKARCA